MCERTQLEVFEKLGIAQSVISRLWQRFRDDGNLSRRYSTGYPRVTTPNEIRYLAVTSKRNRRSTVSDLSCQSLGASGTRFHQENIIERHHFDGVGLLFLERGDLLGSRTDLHVQIGIMTGQIYPDFILKQHVRLFRATMGAEFVFMDDNVCSPHENIVNECLQSEDVFRMDWTVFSPDLNPVEHVY
ncbi:transposable element Tc3 transposase [Trichonephila clavipes]|nr:transposable element Tc3 transposase [Trichonephila clavipes]